MRRAAKAEQTVVALKEAAKRLFAERGYLNTKITDILGEAGRSAGVFYDHFASKEELLDALIQDFREDAAAQAPDIGHDLTDRADLRAHIEVFWRTYEKHLPVMVAMYQASIVDPGRFREHLSTDVLSAHIGSDLVASAISSMLLQFAYVWQATHGKAPGGLDRPVPTADEAIDTLTDLIHTGISDT
ncbi:TetR/AcrR family transcriptional regulator [Kibdelosporangium lantanae]|uniref:TetR/AcrR family transcriptional regulator n=1 Tax=Kibdelosporangium lantanae TaxID=1497396 RepID=A0ABW3MF92_9PSEU